MQVSIIKYAACNDGAKRGEKRFSLFFLEKRSKSLNLIYMKIVQNISVVLCALFMVITSQLVAQPPAGKAKPGTIYGAKTTQGGAITPQQLQQELSKKDTVYAKVKAQVMDVCSNKGCWLTFKLSDSTEAMVKMKDYGFFVPTDLRGKTAVLDGKAYNRTTSVEELKHYAEDAKKSKTEIDAITKAQKDVRFLASGILVVE